MLVCCSHYFFSPEFICSSSWDQNFPLAIRQISRLLRSHFSGGVYNPETLRFDHHQRGFSETVRAHSNLAFINRPLVPQLNERYQTKLSSAGLIYKHFGREIVEQEIQILSPDLSPSDEEIAMVYYKVLRCES